MNMLVNCVVPYFTSIVLTRDDQMNIQIGAFFYTTNEPMVYDLSLPEKFTRSSPTNPPSRHMHSGCLVAIGLPRKSNTDC
jgi:hypothetical protein